MKDFLENEVEIWAVKNLSDSEYELEYQMYSLHDKIGFVNSKGAKFSYPIREVKNCHCHLQTGESPHISNSSRIHFQHCGK
jgi:hypothetical protein